MGKLTDVGDTFNGLYKTKLDLGAFAELPGLMMVFPQIAKLWGSPCKYCNNELPVRAFRDRFLVLGTGAGAGAVSWWKQVAGAGAGAGCQVLVLVL